MLKTKFFVDKLVSALLLFVRALLLGVIAFGGFNSLAGEGDALERAEGGSILQNQTQGFLNALNRIQKQSLMEPGQSKARDLDCPECARPSSLRFMECSEKNDYLESRLEALQVSSPALYSLLSKSQPAVYKSSCLRLAMDMSFDENARSFKSCSARGEITKNFRPCISESYFSLMEQSMNLVSSCMIDYLEPAANPASKRADLRELLGMLTVESGLHVNAVSATGPSGPGQLYGGAITDVNKSDLADIRQSLNSNSNKQCANISELMLQSASPMRSNNTCDKISLEKGNPVLNLLYTFAYQKRVRDHIRQQVFEKSKYAGKLASLSAEEKAKLLRALTVWAHNTGPGGIMVPVKAILIENGQKFSTAKDFLDRLTTVTKTNPHVANKSPARRAETSRYYGSITNSLKLLESVNSGSCLAN